MSSMTLPFRLRSDNGRGSFHRRPHACEFPIGHHGIDLELNAIALDPGTEMRPDLSDVSGLHNGNTASTDRLTDAVLQSETIELITGTSPIDVVSEPRA